LLVDRRELDRDGRSYSIDTLRELRVAMGPDAPIALLIGADSFLGLPGWHEWKALFDFTHFVVAPRPGSPLDGQLPQELAAMASGRWTGSPEVLESTAAGRLFLLDQPLQPESASEVRRRIANGQPWLDLVPAAVAGFILGQGLYPRPAGESGPL
jgi:nicotinate-nucleotide adenylyltransferase